MSREALRHWEHRYAMGERRPDWEPNEWIAARAERLPAGRALDAACGWGRHALWLAGHGHVAMGIDGSVTALRVAREEAGRRGLAGRVLFVQADLDAAPVLASTFDLVVVARFLDRRLVPLFESLVRPGGSLLYASYTTERLVAHPGFNPAFLLAPGELPTLFPRLAVIESEEQGEWAYLHTRREKD